MKHVWRIISLVVLIAFVLGAVCVAVGLLTGADTERIASVIFNRYGLTPDTARDYFEQWVAVGDEVINIVIDGINSI